MAYREFDPTMMDAYQTETINLLTKQSDALEQQITSMETKITALTVSMTAALLVAVTAMKILMTANGNIEIPDSVARTAATEAAKALETQISDLKSEIESLKGEKEKIASAIEETNKFITKLKDKIENLNSDTVDTMQDLIKQIDNYRSKMQTLYNRVGDTLVSFGYEKNEINQQTKFGNLIDDFSDSNIIKHVPFVPSSYIYSGGVLNKRILNGIFKKDVNIVIEKQYEELYEVISDVTNSKNMDTLRDLIISGYGRGEYDKRQPGYQYDLTAVFEKFAQKYNSYTKLKVVDSILEGNLVNGLDQKLRDQMQISGLLMSFSSQLPYIRGINSNLFDQLPFTISSGKRGALSGLNININGSVIPSGTLNPTKRTWFVSEFIPLLGNQMNELQSTLLQGASSSGIFEVWDTALSLFVDLGVVGKINDLASIYDGTIGANNQLKANISEAELKSFIDAFIFGGVLIGGRENEVIISNNVMDLNGSGGFGIGGEAYNYKEKKDVNISQLYYDAMKETMTSEQKKIFKEIKTWTNDNVFYRNNFYTSLTNISISNGKTLNSEENYQTYKHVIDNYLVK